MASVGRSQSIPIIRDAILRREDGIRVIAGASTSTAGASFDLVIDEEALRLGLGGLIPDGAQVFAHLPSAGGDWFDREIPRTSSSGGTSRIVAFVEDGLDRTQFAEVAKAPLGLMDAKGEVVAWFQGPGEGDPIPSAVRLCSSTVYTQQMAQNFIGHLDLPSVVAARGNDAVGYSLSDRGLADLKWGARLDPRAQFRGAYKLPPLLPESFFDVSSGAKALDVGAGGGRFVHELRELGVDAWGVDLTKNEIPLISGAMIQADMSDAHFLPRILEHGPFDLAFSNYGPLYYRTTPDPVMEGILRNVHDALRPGGEFRIFPIAQVDRLRELLSRVPGMEVVVARVHADGPGTYNNFGMGFAILRRTD
jgi:hypothetical protein